MTERVRTESMSERALLDGGPCPRTLSQTILIAEILLRLEADLGLGPNALRPTPRSITLWKLS